MKTKLLFILLCSFFGGMFLSAAPKMQDRLIMPEAIYAVPGIETNIYYRNIFLTINPKNFIYDVKCKKGRCDERRWRFTPKKEDVGTYDLSLKIYDDYGLVAEGKSKLIVSPADAGKGKNISLMLTGSSSVSMLQAYPTHIYNLFKTPGNPTLTMVGEAGPGWPDKLGDIRHNGFGGWSFATFTGPGRKRIAGRSNMRENPYWNAETKKLDFAGYFRKCSIGKAPDVIAVTLGGNDTFSGTDETRDALIENVRKNVITFITALRKDAPGTKIALVIFDYSDVSQDAFGCNYGTLKHRWEYKKNYHKYMQMLRKLVKEKNMPPFELVLLPHVTDNENNGYIENSYATARNKRIKVRTARNALHPREWGYQQGADALYCWMKYMLHKEEQTAKAVKK